MAASHFRLDDLPFDTGVFDMVHIRFIGLGVPEARWSDLLDEATRVLKRGGKLVFVETNYVLPRSTAASQRDSFSSLLSPHFIQPLPNLPIQINLPLIDSLVSSRDLSGPRFERTWTDENVLGAGRDAVLGGKRSCEDEGTRPIERDGQVSVWAWIATKG
ncbi:hypothetical protein IAR55_000336 [Kwoniella newhampshirensis]|uniref:Methyltransferase type 11 domain-containing protein n=1 Tax=Kwoniella newhampshirensis TaxID=1651941 RepID=A0AAW0Z6F7_9TREE